eukprot:gene5371-6517_t
MWSPAGASQECGAYNQFFQGVQLGLTPYDPNAVWPGPPNAPNTTFDPVDYVARFSGYDPSVTRGGSGSGNLTRPMSGRGKWYTEPVALHDIHIELFTAAFQDKLVLVIGDSVDDYMVKNVVATLKESAHMKRWRREFIHPGLDGRFCEANDDTGFTICFLWHFGVKNKGPYHKAAQGHVADGFPEAGCSAGDEVCDTTATRIRSTAAALRSQYGRDPDLVVCSSLLWDLAREDDHKEAVHEVSWMWPMIYHLTENDRAFFSELAEGTGRLIRTVRAAFPKTLPSHILWRTAPTFPNTCWDCWEGLAPALNAVHRIVAKMEGLQVVDWELMINSYPGLQDMSPGVSRVLLTRDGKHPYPEWNVAFFNLLLNLVQQMKEESSMQMHAVKEEAGAAVDSTHEDVALPKPHHKQNAQHRLWQAVHLAATRHSIETGFYRYDLEDTSPAQQYRH